MTWDCYIFWGSITEQLISKAGYKGNGYRRLLMLLWFPIVVVLAQAISGENSGFTIGMSFTAVVSVYLGLATLAFFPWPVHKELRQLRKQLGTNPGQSVT